MAYTTVDGLNGTIKTAIEELQANVPDFASGDESKYARVKSDLSGFEYVSVSGGSGTVTNIATTAPITGGPITTTGTIAITQATTSTDGYLISTDWNTFNNKQATGLSWLLASGGTLTGVNTITSNTANQLIYTGTYTTTANNQYYKNLTGSFTHRATASDVTSVLYINPTFVASANSQLAISVRVDPTYTIGAFTTTANIAFSAENGSFYSSVSSGARSYFRAATVANTWLFSTLTSRYALIGTGGFAVGSLNADDPITGFQSGLRVAISEITASGLAYIFAGTRTDTSGSLFIQRLGLSVTSSSGTLATSLLYINPVYQPSGTFSGGTFRNIYLLPTLNFTVGTNTVYGYDYQPTLTSTTGLTHYAWRHTAGFVAWDSILSPAQITSDQNDYNPTGFNNGGSPAGASILRLNSDASRNVTGLVGGVSGRLLIISNVGSNAIVLKDEDAGSTAANRFAFASDFTLNADQSLTLWYDATSSRWRSING